MKKVQKFIFALYLILIIAISAGTIFFVGKAVSKGMKVYFQEKPLSKPQYQINEKEIEKIIDNLINYQLI